MLKCLIFKKGFSWSVFILLLLSTLFNIGCNHSSNETPAPAIVHLLDGFTESSVIDGKDALVFHDPILRKKHLREGWSFKEDKDRDKFPWPLFSESGIEYLLHK